MHHVFLAILLLAVFTDKPNGNVNSFVNNLDKLLNSIEKERKPCFILGDFNINLLHTISEKFVHTLFANAFHPLISQATRIT